MISEVSSYTEDILRVMSESNAFDNHFMRSGCLKSLKSLKSVYLIKINNSSVSFNTTNST